MGKVVNLRQARKAAARAAARRQGDENAARFGRSRAEAEAEEAARLRAARHLDLHRRDESGGDPAAEGGATPRGGPGDA